MPIKQLDNIGIAVKDVRRAAEFFRDKVGLPVELSLAGEPPSAQVTTGSQYLYVFEVKSSAAAAERHSDLIGNPPGFDHVSFTVDNVDQTYRELRDRGVAFDSEPVTEEAWGIRMAGFRDPEDNSYFLVQTLAPQ
ncbi:VOC family protein [Amycolatopsis rubida]|uniref:Methylmalonyl-CoA/ethylmalonyl-CoA epimerase n=1 Tax=Amycolatopsis rubida TaxID=112413 RepID=A0A1I5VCJ0_9PSEU|nr:MULTISPECIES: VOC family protein [Amycolatopsis]MYW90044.1 VOC family protein [Amycolatopsis rubida]NEC55021.1 VOC family protein [Amycolatopsis rubida]SFQ05195.1 methylmalonyl-CoA/ethylmalonyl-CoA epimerase [Amycolatopsis rubida]